MNGRLHSIESFGTVDGPGIRMVLFMQGCPLRCLYCHNPDTWAQEGGKEYTTDEILREYKRNESFYKKGGITVSGGEPLLQIDFLTELFEKAKAKGIHTCIDTSGIVFNRNSEKAMEKMDALMKYTDLVMLDIKHIDPAKHKALTGKDNKNILEFARYICEKKVDLWVRHVVVPEVTDSKEDLENLGKFLGTLTNLKALDVIPYHTLGVSKYEKLNIPYALEGIQPLELKDAVKAKKIIIDAMRSVR